MKVRRGGVVSLGDVQVIQDVGIHLMQETLLKGLQNSFIQNDRFDPLHEATTEQQLFDQLPSIAEQIAASGKANVGVEHQSRLHSTSLEASEWHGLLNSFATRLSQASVGTTILDLNSAFNTARLAGLDSAGISMVHGAPKVDIIAAFIGKSAEGGSVMYQTDMSVLGRDQAAPAMSATVSNKKSASVSQNTVTLLLIAGKAFAISNAQVSMQGN